MRPLTFSRVLLLALVAAAGLWGTVRWLPREPEGVWVLIPPPVTQPAEALEPPDEALPSGVKGRERVLLPGLRHRYTFDLDQRTTEEAADGRKTTHTGWSGALELTYLGSAGGQHLFSGRIIPTAPEALQPRFERPLYMAQDARGRVLSVHFDAAQDPAARRLVRTLLAATQFVAEDGTHWSTEETDATGDFESEYHAGGSTHTYVKTKRRYLRRASGATALPRTRGHLDFTLFEDGHVREVTGSEVVEDGPVRRETRVAMTCAGTDDHALTLQSFQAARPGLTAEPLSEPEPTTLPTVATGTRLEDLVARPPPSQASEARANTQARLAAMPRSGPAEAQADTQARLAALFRTDSAEVERAARWVRQGTADAAALLEALARAGTPEAQRALTGVLKEPRLRLETRAHAARVAGGLERPTAELAEALTRLVDTEERLREPAALAVGALSRTLALAEPERGGQLLEGMLQRCGAKKVPTEVCLRALARAGSPSGLAYARSALSHRSPGVRGAATEALRAIPGAEPDALLDRVLLEDPDARVRARAALAISQRVAGPHMQAAARVLREEPSEQVRLEVVRMLGGLKSVDPAAEVLLRDAAENDPATRVRHEAASLLAG